MNTNTHTAKQVNRILKACKCAVHSRKDKKASRAKQKRFFSKYEF